ncbi:hypothetical protein GBA52_023018 [Prunus armeniaca]|nr:hypothetical protein GBA52_023018 [Prunus armeniaca]
MRALRLPHNLTPIIINNQHRTAIPKGTVKLLRAGDHSLTKYAFPPLKHFLGSIQSQSSGSIDPDVQSGSGHRMVVTFF